MASSIRWIYGCDQNGCDQNGRDQGDTSLDGTAVDFALELRDFGFTYPDEEPLFEHLSLQVPRGAFLLVCGNTGSGKSTLLRCFKPELQSFGQTSGHIFVDGVESKDMTCEQSATTLGTVQQNPDNQLVCHDVIHELAFGLENIGAPQETIARNVAEVAHYFGLNGVLHTPMSQLSGGTKQLINVASGLSLRPSIMLFDEPTAQLDSVAAHDFLHALFRLNRECGITLVVATHDPVLYQNYATCCLALCEENGEGAPVDFADVSGASSIFGVSGVPEDPEALEAPDTSDDPGAFDTSGASVSSVSAQAAISGAADADAFPLVLKDVSYAYGKKAPFVLDGLSLEVESGACHALVGGNGSGKTTTLLLAAQVFKPVAGRVTNALHDAQSYVAQKPWLYFMCDTVDEELRHCQKSVGFSDGEVNDVAERFHLSAHLSKHPYDLSGGMQQVLALAKAVLCHPRLLLLDEPTKGLDARLKGIVVEELRRLRGQGVTVVVATHDMSFVHAACTHVSLLFDGKAISTQPEREFWKQGFVYTLPASQGNQPAFGIVGDSKQSAPTHALRA